MKKKISVVIPTYNEEGNVVPLSAAIVRVMEEQLSRYDYEIIFIDNHSKDDTRRKLRELCGENKRIKAIFNARNFGQMRSPVHGLKTGLGRLCDPHVRGLSGPGGNDRAVCEGVGKGA